MDIDASDLYSNSFVPIKLVFHLVNRESFETVDSTQPIMVSNQARSSSDTYEPGWIEFKQHTCHENTCQNNGTCLTPDVNARAALNQFECACPVGFIGFKCEKETARLNIHFESKMIAKYRYIPIIVVRLIYIYQYTQSNNSYRRLLKNVQSEKPLPIFHRTRELHQFHFAFIQLAIERNCCSCIDPSFNEKIVNLVSL
ncbi:unnamed protein product [Rotaria magnacalcarata]|uniref:EGF-like domain-containing protein n=1 Tax=Rotaria magnacalcarata TaxID=392030 RepID=A0A8S3BZ83_9BILA|nr:unnamed protein product [Rotaria magnacalcarata]